MTAADYYEAANEAVRWAADFQRRPYGAAFARGFRLEAIRLRAEGRRLAAMIRPPGKPA